MTDVGLGLGNNPKLELANIRDALDRAAIVAITDPAGTIIHVNDKFCQISQYSREELIGKSHRVVNSGHHPREFFVSMWRTISNGRVWEGEIRNRAKDGSTYWVHTTIVPFLNELGKPYQYVSIRFEITQRKLAEEALKIYAAKLERSNQELQDFASIAAHDLQEPLRKIQTFGDRLKTKAAQALSDEARDYLERMQSAAVRMRALIDDLLSYSRVHSNAKPFAPINLNQIVAEVLSDLEVRVEQTRASVDVQELPTIDADPMQMRQLFQNVIGNALKFHKPEVAPVIKVESHRDGDRVVIEIKDNGIGFDSKYAERIFTIFQRLHGRQEYEGTGVGLAVVRRIVERHGGSVSATSEPGQGATFHVTLPARQERK